MNNFEIAEVLMKLEVTADRFMGVYSSDNLPERIESGGCLIANTDPSSASGRHWISMFKRQRREDSTVEYFDPLGKRPAQGAMTDYFRDKSYVYNCKQLQSNDSESCGLFCIFFLYYRCLGYSMNSIVDDLLTDDVNTNEFIIAISKLYFV